MKNLIDNFYNRPIDSNSYINIYTLGVKYVVEKERTENPKYRCGLKVGELPKKNMRKKKRRKK